MTNDMCGIETDNEVDAVPRRVANEGRGETTARLRATARRVPPLQGMVSLFGPSSQGVALGCRVLAPSARRRAGTNTDPQWVSRRVGAKRGGHECGCSLGLPKHHPNGAQVISLRQRPRNPGRKQPKP